MRVVLGMALTLLAARHACRFREFKERAEALEAAGLRE
jgi:hypothetical protein